MRDTKEVSDLQQPQASIMGQGTLQEKMTQCLQSEMWEQAAFLHKTPWQGILHAVVLQLLGRDQMHSRTTPVALALSDAIAPSPPPPAPSRSH